VVDLVSPRQTRSVMTLFRGVEHHSRALRAIEQAGSRGSALRIFVTPQIQTVLGFPISRLLARILCFHSSCFLRADPTKKESRRLSKRREAETGALHFTLTNLGIVTGVRARIITSVFAIILKLLTRSGGSPSGRCPRQISSLSLHSLTIRRHHRHCRRIGRSANEPSSRWGRET
jgi:hypothetical protein